MIPALWKLREWLTISEAAQYLSSVIGERPESAQGIGGSEVLRLALDRHLKLSVNLPTGTKGWFHPDGADVTTRPTSMERIDGLWDLLMEGAGKQQVEHDHHFRAHLPFISVEGITGAWVERAGVRRQLEPMRGSTGMWTKSPSALSEGSVLGVRVEVLDALAAKMRKPPALGESTWKDVTIEFTSDERVQVTVKDRTYSKNFSEMGFEDGRTKLPNRAWAALRALAESGGVAKVADDVNRDTAEKRMQEIRKRLREHFESERIELSSESDPLPYVQGEGYRPRFTLRLRPSFHN